MKKYIYIIIALIAIAVSACSRSNKVRVRIIETNERAFVSVPGQLYRKLDTIVVWYSPSMQSWKLDQHWAKFKGNSQVTTGDQLYYKARIE